MSEVDLSRSIGLTLIRLIGLIRIYLDLSLLSSDRRASKLSAEFSRGPKENAGRERTTVTDGASSCPQATRVPWDSVAHRRPSAARKGVPLRSRRLDDIARQMPLRARGRHRSRRSPAPPLPPKAASRTPANASGVHSTSEVPKRGSSTDGLSIAGGLAHIPST